MTFAPGPEILRRLLQQRQNASVFAQGRAGFAPRSANRCGQFTCHPGRTSSPLRPCLSFRYTQVRLNRQRTTFSARRYHHVALRALCAAPRGALRAPCGVPDVFLCAPCVVPDAAPYQTSASQWTALRAWCLSGLQQVTPSELQARPQVQTQPRIQKEQERFDDRPASVPNVHPCQAPGLLPSCTSHKLQ